MANPHSSVNSSQLSGSTSPQMIRLSPFPNLGGFGERSGDMPLDLNSSQKHSQHILRASNAFERVSTGQTEQREFEISPIGDLGLSAGQDIVMSDGVLDFSSDKAVLDGAPSKITQRSRCHWSHNEIMALFNAKKAEADKYDHEDVENEKAGKKMRVPPERWDDVAEFCRAMGSNKSASQCKDKWERIWLAFRKITDWEKQPPPGKSSFWTMQGDEREKEGFPRVFDKELYDAMAARFGFMKSIDLATIVIDSSIVDDSGAELKILQMDPPTNTDAEPPQNAVAAIEESPSVVDDQALASSGQKRKAPPRSSAKQPTQEGKKKRIVYGVYKVEKVEQNGASKNSKNKGGDFNERKLQLEERKLKLAEKRFQLEEKKLEATIEIGKGLITSMERMTQTISSLGVFSSH